MIKKEKEIKSEESVSSFSSSSGFHQNKPEQASSPQRLAQDGDDEIQLSKDQQAVYDAVVQGQNVFFTGCAGTGKSTLMDRLQRDLDPHSTVFVSSTGISALRFADGTLFKWAGILTGEGTVNQCVNLIKKSEEKKQNWKDVRRLVCDEVSMTQGVLWDKLEEIGRIMKRSDDPFGGIQIVMTGDFLQLPPVIKDDDSLDPNSNANINNMLYKKPKKLKVMAFHSKMWKKCKMKSFELKQVFRQSDPTFINALADLRVGIVSSRVLRVINFVSSRELPEDDGIKPTILFSKKMKAEQFNLSELDKLETDVVHFHARDAGRAEEKAHLDESTLAVSHLRLKKGAQVLLIVNDSKNRKLANGVRGVVIDFGRDDEGYICPIVRYDNGITAMAEYSTWERKRRGVVVATRTQIRLILAWGLTIHKSQGMTLSKLIVSLGDCFEYGQTYVALSRAKTLEGLHVTDFNPLGVKAHPEALQFYANLNNNNNDDQDQDQQNNNDNDTSTSSTMQIKPTTDRELESKKFDAFYTNVKNTWLGSNNKAHMPINIASSSSSTNGNSSSNKNKIINNNQNKSLDAFKRNCVTVASHPFRFQNNNHNTATSFTPVPPMPMPTPIQKAPVITQNFKRKADGVKDKVSSFFNDILTETYKKQKLSPSSLSSVPPPPPAHSQQQQLQYPPFTHHVSLAPISSPLELYTRASKILSEIGNKRKYESKTQDEKAISVMKNIMAKSTTTTDSMWSKVKRKKRSWEDDDD